MDDQLATDGRPNAPCPSDPGKKTARRPRARRVLAMTIPLVVTAFVVPVLVPASQADQADAVTALAAPAAMTAPQPVVSAAPDAQVNLAQSTVKTAVAPPPLPPKPAARPAAKKRSSSGGSAPAAPSNDQAPAASSGGAGWPSQERLNQVAAEVGAGSVKFVLRDRGSWGLADWYNGTVYVAPRTPASKLKSVVIHEWAHIHHARVYGGNISALTADANRVFGGSGLTGAERAADCMAKLRGASWVNYTSCGDPGHREAARTLLNGGRI